MKKIITEGHRGACALYPVLSGSALCDEGVDRLEKAIADLKAALEAKVAALEEKDVALEAKSAAERALSVANDIFYCIFLLNAETSSPIGTAGQLYNKSVFCKLGQSRA